MSNSTHTPNTQKRRRGKMSAFERAVRMLGRRGYGVKEMEQALLKKEYEDEIVADTMSKLVEYRYLNDEIFAYERIRSRATLSKWGKRRIQTELKNKGIDERTITKAFNRFEEGDDERLGQEHNWQQEAVELLLKKYGHWPQELDNAINDANDWEDKQEALKEAQKQKAKRINFLLRRGFTSDQAQKALQKSM